MRARIQHILSRDWNVFTIGNTYICINMYSCARYVRTAKRINIHKKLPLAATFLQFQGTQTSALAWIELPPVTTTFLCSSNSHLYWQNFVHSPVSRCRACTGFSRSYCKQIRRLISYSECNCFVRLLQATRIFFASHKRNRNRSASQNHRNRDKPVSTSFVRRIFGGT